MLYTLQPWLKYFAILGLVPYTEQSEHQRIQRIYTSFIIASNTSLCLYIVLYLPYEGDTFVTLFVSCVVFISQIATMSVILFQSMLNYEDFYEFCLQIKFLRFLYECQLQLPVRKLPKRRFIKYFVLVVCTLVVLVVPIYVKLKFAYKGYFLYSLCAVLITRCQCLLLLLYVEILGYHGELLALKLQGVVSCQVLGQRCILDVNYGRLCSFEYLISLKSAYMKLHQLCCQFNALYGWSLLCIFVVMFLDSMINIYWTFLILANVYDFTLIYMTLSTFMPLVVLLFAFCNCGEYCKRQHMIIGSHLRRLTRISQKEFHMQAYDALMSEFANQVQQDALLISAEGFMNIDYCLLMSIFTAMVTYLIVLMQFGSL